MNILSSLDETYREYSLAPTVDLVRFWNFNSEGHSRPSRCRSHPCRRWGVEVHCL